MAPLGKFTFDVVEAIPPMTRPNSGNRNSRFTDLDIALENLISSHPAPTPVVQILDYTVEVDEDGTEKPVDDATARQRASGRIAQIKARGRKTEDGWVIASRNGKVYAQYFGVGNVPDEFVRKEKAVGEAVPV